VSKKKQIAITDLSPTESAAREQARIPLEAPLTEKEIAAREAEKQRLLATITPPVEKKQDTTGLIGKFIAKATAPSNDLLEAERAECEKIARPLLTETKSIQTTMGILRSKWQDKVEAYVATDWNALRAATPSMLVWETKGRGGYVDISKQAVHDFQVAVSSARTTLGSSFGDDKPGPGEVNAISLSHAAEILSSLLVGGNYIGDRSLDGPSIRVQSATFRRAIVQMRYWVDRSRAILQSAERAVDRFVQTERTLTEILAKLDPAEVGPQLKRTTLPTLEERPECGTSSYVDFDPRSA
jgi:hypothetical protein